MFANRTKLRSPKRVNETVKETKHTLITFLPTATEKTETEKDCSSSSSHVGGDSGVSSESAIHASSIENKNVFELLVSMMSFIL